MLGEQRREFPAALPGRDHGVSDLHSVAYRMAAHEMGGDANKIAGGFGVHRRDDSIKNIFKKFQKSENYIYHLSIRHAKRSLVVKLFTFQEDYMDTMATSQSFSLGQTVITPNAMDCLDSLDVFNALRRHARGDWGDVPPEDKTENELSLKSGFRLLSAYTDRNGNKFWIITETDRSVTVLLPDEFQSAIGCWGIAPVVTTARVAKTKEN